MYLIPLILTIITSTIISSRDFINKEVKREIDLRNKVIKVTTEILINSESERPKYSYNYIISKNYSSYLVHLNLEMKMKDGSSAKINYNEIDSKEDYKIYELQLNDYPLSQKEMRTIIATEYYFERLEFYPKKITLKETQNALYRDSLNYFSAYETETQKVTVILPSEYTSLIRYTMKGSNKIKNKIHYNLASYKPFEYENLYIHYSYDIPFVVMNYAIREFRVSHWGNIAVTENYQLANIGALLDGEFSRLDYDPYGRYGSRNAHKELTATLPLKSNGLWYRDEIGNVSTSSAVRNWDNAVLKLNPRFPILGGWISNFDIGYNLPTKFNVKKNNNNEYMLNVSFGMPFEDILAKNYTVRVVLPEGADNIKVYLPIEGKVELDNKLEYDTLDLFGRKAVEIKMKNVFDIHKVDFQVYYSFSNFSLTFKPIIVIFYFLIIFCSLIVYFRADLSLSPKIEEKQKIE